MKAEVKKLSKSKIEILFEIPWKEFESCFKNASLVLVKM